MQPASAAHIYQPRHEEIGMVGSACDNCGHDRRQHSRNGCTEPGCPCKVTYMDQRGKR